MSILNLFHKDELKTINNFPKIKDFLLKIEEIANKKKELVKKIEIDKIFKLKDKIKQIYDYEKEELAIEKREIGLLKNKKKIIDLFNNLKQNLKKQIKIIKKLEKDNSKLEEYCSILHELLIDEFKIISIEEKQIIQMEMEFKKEFFNKKKILFEEKGMVFRHLGHTSEDISAAMQIIKEQFDEDDIANAKLVYDSHINFEKYVSKMQVDYYLVIDKKNKVIGAVGNYYYYWLKNRKNIEFWFYFFDSINIDSFYNLINYSFKNYKRIIFEIPSNKKIKSHNNIKYIGKLPYGYGKYDSLFYEIKKNNRRYNGEYKLTKTNNIAPYLTNTPILPYRNTINEYFIIEKNGKIAGLSGIFYFGWHPRTVIWGGWGAVKSEFQRQGIHSWTIKCRAKLGKIHGAKIFAIFTSSDLKGAIGSYKKNGFKLQYIIKDFYGKGYDYMLFTKSL